MQISPGTQEQSFTQVPSSVAAHIVEGPQRALLVAAHKVRRPGEGAGHKVAAAPKEAQVRDHLGGSQGEADCGAMREEWGTNLAQSLQELILKRKGV